MPEKNLTFPDYCKLAAQRMAEAGAIAADKVTEASQSLMSTTKAKLDAHKAKRTDGETSPDTSWIDELLDSQQDPIGSEVTADEAHWERLSAALLSHEELSAELASMDARIAAIEEQPEPVNAPRTANDLGFFGTMKESLTLIGFAFLCLLGMPILATMLGGMIDYPGLSGEAIVWTLGTMIWAFILLTHLSRVGAFPDLPLSFRLQAVAAAGLTNAGIYVATPDGPASIQMILYWIVSVVLVMFVISAFANGLGQMVRRIRS